MKVLYEALNPEVEYQGGTVKALFGGTPADMPLVKRLDSLDGKTVNLVVVGGETSPLFYVSDFGYSGSQSVDRWRSLSSLGECADGSCGLPDEMVDYDE